MYSNEYLLNKIYLRLVISTISLGIEPEKELLSGVRVMLEQEQKGMERSVRESGRRDENKERELEDK